MDKCQIGVDGVVARFESLRERSKKNIYITLTGGEPTIVKEFVALCKKLVDKKFIIELQSNMITGTIIKKFVDNVDPKGIAQIMATYHGWALDTKYPTMQENYINNFKYAMNNNITCVLKTVVPPNEVFTMKDKLAKLRKLLPTGAIIMPWVFIKGSPTSITDMNGAYPYAYTPQQHVEMDSLCKIRNACQALYRHGAGFFCGMQCDAGNGFFIIKRDGTAGRCYTIKTGAGVLGNLVNNDINLFSSPKKCTYKLCGTPFWGMWFGVTPWDYVPNGDKNSAYYCKFGPKWN